jgi:3'-phosphoadenosine 5'-phosphosulfate sulfotransferase (PAPS reductase)/FAD synthetase
MTVALLSPTSPLVFPVETDSVIGDLLRCHAPVALGVSGGKDSSAMSLVVARYLDEIGHAGPRLLIHSDLGRIEWQGSLPMCQRLAEHLGMELVVVRRQAGDLLDRWRVRWQNNVARYANLEAVRLILPWSTPGMLFCRSELKAAIISRELVQRFPGQVIVSAVGIRREESTSRANAPISAPELRLTNKTQHTRGMRWNPIATWSLEQVLAYHQLRQFPLHEGYALGMTRIGCAFCILASLGDLITSAAVKTNQEVYRELVDIEILSTFSFQSGHWLGDVAPALLTQAQQRGLEEAKRRAEVRIAAESRIGKHLLYCKGWPTVLPTYEEAQILAEVRRIVAAAVGIEIGYTDADSIRDRYVELMAIQAQKQATQRKRGKVA